MNKKRTTYQFYLFNGFMFLVGLFLSAGITTAVVALIDLIFYYINRPKISYLAQKAYNQHIMQRVGWSVFFGIIILTFISLAAYYYFKVLRKSKSLKSQL